MEGGVVIGAIRRRDYPTALHIASHIDEEPYHSSVTSCRVLVDQRQSGGISFGDSVWWSKDNQFLMWTPKRNLQKKPSSMREGRDYDIRISILEAPEVLK